MAVNPYLSVKGYVDMDTPIGMCTPSAITLTYIVYFVTSS